MILALEKRDENHLEEMLTRIRKENVI